MHLVNNKNMDFLNFLEQLDVEDVRSLRCALLSNDTQTATEVSCKMFRQYPEHKFVPKSYCEFYGKRMCELILHSRENVVRGVIFKRGNTNRTESAKYTLRTLLPYITQRTNLATFTWSTVDLDLDRHEGFQHDVSYSQDCPLFQCAVLLGPTQWVEESFTHLLVNNCLVISDSNVECSTLKMVWSGTFYLYLYTKQGEPDGQLTRQLAQVASQLHV